MSQTLGKDRKVFIFSFVVAATTVIAGVLHLQMAPRSLSHDLGEGILFLIGGLLQIFWAVPVIKRWGRIWQIIGIVGTAVFFALWLASRFHVFPGGVPETSSHEHVPTREIHNGNMTGNEFPRGPQPRGQSIVIGGIMVPPIEFFQLAFIGLYSILAKMMKK